jgi:RimJ/RimL family protein N-acetyltransferase
LRLERDKVDLRSFTLKNLTSSYLDWLLDPPLMRFGHERFLKSNIERCRAYLDSFFGKDNLFVANYHEGTFTGAMTVYQSAVHNTAYIGLHTGAGMQGLGLRKDFWSTFMNHLLANVIRKVTVGTLKCNAAMVRIMRNFGMKPNRVRSEQEVVEGVPQDFCYFTMFTEA